LSRKGFPNPNEKQISKGASVQNGRSFLFGFIARAKAKARAYCGLKNRIFYCHDAAALCAISS
jgi:hypothetical protein